MNYHFAALRFYNDENLRDKCYWYVSDFPLSEGEKVLAPVGMRGKLQAGIVEQVLFTDPEHAPYDTRLIKSVTARLGARKLVLDGTELLEFGGVKYDERHYTPFGRIILAKELPERMEELKAYCAVPLAEEGNAFEKIASARGCVLLYGERGREIFKHLLALVKGEELTLAGVGGSTIERLKEKLQ